jgi:dTDP-L-rhamnose 4-epimerase
VERHLGERVLVTGGAGFIGSHLVDALIARGDVVRVLDNLLPQAHPTGTARFVPAAAELVVGDLCDRATVDRALDDVRVVWHLGGMVGNGQSMYDIRRYVETNAVGTATLLEAMLARRAQFRRLVVASSMVVYGDGAYRCPEHGLAAGVHRPRARLERGAWEPVCAACGREVEPVATREDHPGTPTSPYGISKRDQEDLALVVGRAHGLPTIALRYLNTYGSRQALGNPYTGVAAIIATRLLNGRPPVIFEDGGQRRDFVHVSDVVQANLAAADADETACYQAYNVGTGRSVTVLELARLIARGLGRPAEIQPSGQFRMGDIRHCFADVSRAKALLGWQARRSLEDGIDELLRWASGERPADLTERAHAELRARRLIGAADAPRAPASPRG